MVGKTPTILIGGASQPAKTLPDLVKLCRAQPGKIVFEIVGVPEELAREAFRLAAAKLPLRTTFVSRQLGA